MFKFLVRFNKNVKGLFGQPPLVFEENSVKYKNGTRFFLEEDKCH